MQKQLWDITRNNSLFLSAAAAAGSDVIQPAFTALANDINLYDATHYLAELATIKKLFINDDARAQMLSQLIKYADIGIDGIDVRQSEGVMGLKTHSLDSMRFRKRHVIKLQKTLNCRSLMTCSSTIKAREMAFGWAPPMNRRAQKLRWRFSR